jgi:hypothetical protein
MKYIIILIAVALSIVSCSATPPAHKSVTLVSTNTLVVTAPLSGPPITHINFYRADIASSTWGNPLATILVTNGQVVELPNTTQPWFSTNVFTSESTNVNNGAASDYSNIMTNALSGQKELQLNTPTTTQK